MIRSNSVERTNGRILPPMSKYMVVQPTSQSLSFNGLCTRMRRLPTNGAASESKLAMMAERFSAGEFVNAQSNDFKTWNVRFKLESRTNTIQNCVVR
ncbi:MAG: hypothetical protein IT427_02540 [Pirellulales bacterium]|nr:hypothetical protein [Pirellulales bacterium]